MPPSVGAASLHGSGGVGAEIGSFMEQEDRPAAPTEAAPIEETAAAIRKTLDSLL